MFQICKPPCDQDLILSSHRNSVEGLFRSLDGGICASTRLDLLLLPSPSPTCLLAASSSLCTLLALFLTVLPSRCLKTSMDEDFAGKQFSRYLLSSILGTGSAGSVYKGVDVTREDSRTFAIKCIAKSHSTRRLRQQVAEIVNHNAVTWCPHVMMLCDFFEENGHFFLVLPLCEMDMFRAIWKEKVFWRNDGLIKKAFVELLDGVLAFHQKGVFHRDLKPENVMCNMGGLRIVIGDFGLSTNRRLCRDGGCGTVSYMSPGQSLVTTYTVITN